MLTSQIIPFCDSRAQASDGSAILTGKTVNDYPKNLFANLSDNISGICSATAINIGSSAKPGEVTDDDQRRLFGYFFDRAVELGYKLMKAPETMKNVHYNLADIFGFYKVDIPEAQLKQLEALDVKKNVLFIQVNDFMKANKLYDNPMAEWLFPFLLSASTTGLRFVREMDLTAGK